MEELPHENGKYLLKDGKWQFVSAFEDKKGIYGDIKLKGIVTDRYNIIFDERKKMVRPVGFESTLYDNVGEPIPDNLYECLSSFKRAPPIVTNKQFDGGRNIDTLLKYLPDPTSCGIASGRKPSGPCHFGHKLVISTLAFFQQNGVQIFVPIADLEADLDPKIKNRRQHQYLAADNLLDWGACGLDLDAAHVYLQSEETRVLTLGYMVARGLNFNTYIDIYGRDTVADELCFLFANLAQVGDILLPQHPDFGKKHSFMLSGTDQDGNMSITTALSKAAIERGSEHIKTIPSSLYIKTISNLEGKKESASEPETTIYLGPSRNVYSSDSSGHKILEEINKLSLEERIRDTYSKIDKFRLKDEAKVLQAIERRHLVLSEFDDSTTIDRFTLQIVAAIKQHQKRRRDVYVYALLKALGEYNNSPQSHDKEKEAIFKGLERNFLAFNAVENATRPSFWNTPPEAYVPEEKRKVRTRWYHQIARMADELVL